MIRGFLLMLCFDLLGEYIQRWLSLPMSGPLIGMFLLVTLLLVEPRVATPGTTRAAHGLTSNMALFFVPAGVGVIDQAQRIRAEWSPILMGLLVSTLAALLVTAFVMQRIGVSDLTNALSDANGTD